MGTLFLIAMLVTLFLGAVGTLATVGAVLWLWPGLLRGLGLLLLVCNAYRLVLGVLLFHWVIGPALMWLAIGAGLWLLGHWLYALRWHTWRTQLAAQIFELPGLRALPPAGC